MNSTPSSVAAPRLTLGPTLMFLLVVISALGPLAMNGVLPATTAIMDDFVASYGRAQLVLTAFMVAVLIAQIVVGQAADRFGRRPVMITCLALFSAGSTLCAVAPSMEMLLLARLVQGAGAAACMVLPRTIVRDLYDRDKAASVIGYMTVAMMVAPLFGPAIGGWITTHHHWRLMYVGLAIAGLVILVAAFVLQRETLVSPVGDGGATTRGPAVGAMRGLMSQPVFLALVVVLSGSVGVYYSFLAGAPGVAMRSRGMAPSDYGLWFAIVGVGYLLGNLVAGRCSSMFGALKMVKLGLLPLMVGLLLFWGLSGSTHPVALFLPMQFVAFSNGMSLPNLMSSIMSVNPSLAGTASGLAGTVQMGMGVLLTILVGFLVPFGDQWLFVVVTACIALAAVGAWLLIRLKINWTEH